MYVILPPMLTMPDLKRYPSSFVRSSINFSAKVNCAFLVYKKQRIYYQGLSLFDFYIPHLIRLRFQGNRNKLGIGIFVCNVTWNYTYWPFNPRSLIFSICWTVDPEILNPNLPSVLIYTMILRSKVY